MSRDFTEYCRECHWAANYAHDGRQTPATLLFWGKFFPDELRNLGPVCTEHAYKVLDALRSSDKDAAPRHSQIYTYIADALNDVKTNRAAIYVFPQKEDARAIERKAHPLLSRDADGNFIATDARDA